MAITDPENAGSINVLFNNGFVFERQSVVFDGDERLNIYRSGLLWCALILIGVKTCGCFACYMQ